jgi:carboxyl-terminal processing protease
MSKTKLKAAGALAVVALAFGIGLYSGVTEFSASAQTPSSVSNVDMAQFWSAWQILQDNFVQVHASTTIPTDQDKIYGAIAGLTDSYGDPYTVFLPPSDAQVFNDDITGSFGGVGMEVGDTNNGIEVTPLKGSPAEAAGVKSGDILLSIDGTSTQGMLSGDAVKLIRGPVGTKVKLTFARSGETAPVTISVTRQTINIPIIDSKDIGNGIYEISLYSFSQNSADLFRTALRSYLQSGDTKLLLDLRGNPGGYLDAAVDMASYFLPVGDSVVTEDFKGHADNITHRSLGYNVFANKKLSMAILVDQDTASAAEILSGALQQHGVAKLVGTRTFGKGSVQQLVDLGGGAELKVTVARWLTPNGTSISDGGLQPDIHATTTVADIQAGKDPQKDAAVAWLETQ